MVSNYLKMIVSTPQSEFGTSKPLRKFISVSMPAACINDCTLHHFLYPGMAYGMPWSPPYALEEPIFKLKMGRIYQPDRLAQRLAEVLLSASIGGGLEVKIAGLLTMACLS
jgi:hypothetical protein